MLFLTQIVAVQCHVHISYIFTITQYQGIILKENKNYDIMFGLSLPGMYCLTLTISRPYVWSSTVIQCCFYYYHHYEITHYDYFPIVIHDQLHPKVTTMLYTELTSRYWH